MKRASDGQLLVAVVAVPVGALLFVSAIDALFGETNKGETIAIGCALILMISQLLPQVMGLRFAAYGPRNLQNRIGFYGAFVACLLLAQMPSAAAGFGQALLGWLPLPIIIALIGGAELWRQDAALRRHPRARRKVWRDVAIGLGLALGLGAIFAATKGATAPQALWAGLVFCGVVLAAPQIQWKRAAHMTGLRLVTLTLAYGICFAAMMYIFIFVQRFGQMAAEDVMPLLVGSAIGSFIAGGIIVLTARNKAKNG